MRRVVLVHRVQDGPHSSAGITGLRAVLADHGFPDGLDERQVGVDRLGHGLVGEAGVGAAAEGAGFYGQHVDAEGCHLAP